nr:MAG TPA: hypothetical protein [Caudoviricetes sp.]
MKILNLFMFIYQKELQQRMLQKYGLLKEVAV